MKRGRCQCGRSIFFANTHCLGCQRTLGRCAVCGNLASFASTQGDQFTCDHCQAEVMACTNRLTGVCTSMVPDTSQLCRYCQFTTVIPNLSNDENWRHWTELERAKKRLILQIEGLGLAPFSPRTSLNRPLCFEFKEDEVAPDGSWQRIYTGHDAGVITLNILEADSVYREKVRVELGEPQRTVIGHLRHEYGHYLDWCREQYSDGDYQQLFGDPDAISYEQAKSRYYELGPNPNWFSTHVSAYASMHPWEDFAETVNVYLDILAIAETANDQFSAEIDISPASSVGHILDKVLPLAVAVSEFNFDMGLPVLLPESLPGPAVEKLAYIHDLRRENGREISW